MIRVVIIEDEIPARNKLKRLLETSGSPIQITAEIDTVAAGIDYLSATTADVIFSDIELLDGQAFEIYRQVAVTCPIIFTTAYDQFWMHAFETNGIDYLLKPFSRERFTRSWQKFLQLSHPESDDNQLISRLRQLIGQPLPLKTFRQRFAMQAPQDIYFITTDSITFFEAAGGTVFAFDATGKKHITTLTTLKTAESELSPEAFFRINRSELIHKKYVERIERYGKNTLAVKLKGAATYLKTSQSVTAAFREWLDK